MAIKENIAETAVAKFEAKSSVGEAQNLLRIAKIFPSKSLTKFAEQLGKAKTIYDLAVSKAKTGEATKNVTLDATKIAGNDNELITPCERLNDYCGNNELNNGIAYLKFLDEGVHTLNTLYDDSGARKAIEKISISQFEYVVNALSNIDDCNITNLQYLKANTASFRSNYLNCIAYFTALQHLLTLFNLHVLLVENLEIAREALRNSNSLENLQKVLAANSECQNSLAHMSHLIDEASVGIIQSLRNRLLPNNIKFCYYIEQELSNHQTIENAMKGRFEAFQQSFDTQKTYPLNAEGKKKYWDKADAEPTLPEGYKMVDFSGLPLFSKHNDDANAIDFNDVMQGNMDNCYLLAPISGMANVSPQKISDMIEFVEKGVYKVRLYLPIPNGDVQETWVTVSTKFPKNIMTHEQLGAKTGDNELWVMLIEKAYAKAMGGYKAIDKSMTSGATEQILTGKAGKSINLDKITPDQYPIYLIKGNTTSTKYTEPRDPSHRFGRVDNKIRGIQLDSKTKAFLQFNHVYHIESYNATTQIIQLRNPHGEQHLNLTMVDYLYYFTELSVVNMD